MYLERVGQNNQVKCKAVFDFLGSSSVGFYCLSETRVHESNPGSVSSRFGNFWDYSCCYSNSGVGRIWVMWKMSLFSFSPHVMDGQFVTGTLTYLFSGVCVRCSVFTFGWENLVLLDYILKFLGGLLFKVI